MRRHLGQLWGRRAPTLIAGLLLGAGCGGASPLSGVTANLRVSNGQFVPGTLVADLTATGAAAQQINLPNTNVFAGQQNLSVSGAVQDGSAVLVGLGDDVGYWIVPTTVADITLTDSYDFSTQLTFSPLIPVGKHPLIFRGVGTDGNPGPALVYQMNVTEPVPTGGLVISLQWDTESDMDLHVVVPNTTDPTTPIEIWYKAPVGLAGLNPGDPPYTADQIAAAGYLDFDSNASCVIDGRRQENVIFTQTPPPGAYTVRVDANSLCGQPDAQWQVTATTGDGTQVGFAQWEATDADTRGAHVAGSGRLAFDFTLYSQSP